MSFLITHFTECGYSNREHGTQGKYQEFVETFFFCVEGKKLLWEEKTVTIETTEILRIESREASINKCKGK